MLRSAELSADLVYRWRLERGEGPIAVAWLMVNPSKADAEIDDPTIGKVDGFTARWFGPARRIVGNKFAYRATDVAGLRTAADPIGAENDAHLAQIVADADAVIVGWGPLAKLPPHLRRRWRDVAAIISAAGHQPMCFGLCQDGQPRHPLMVAYATPPQVWRAPL